MPTTKDGLQRLLEFYLYGTLRAAESLGNAPLFIRTVEEKGLRKFLIENMPAFQPSDNAHEACVAYSRAAEARGLFEPDSTFRGDADLVQGEIGDACPYRRVCTIRHDEGLPVHCLRAFALAEMLRIRLDADFDWKLTRFGRPCKITLKRARWGT